MRRLFALLSLSTLAACGDAPTTPPAHDTGYTECVAMRCSPGQYCSGTGTCENGCLSNVNCSGDQTCEKRGREVGSCENKVPPEMPRDAGSLESASLTACKAACDKGQGCGYFGPGDVVSCKTTCENVGPTPQQALADCVKNTACTSTLPSCFDEGCGTGLFTCCGPGTAYQCSGGLNCVGHICT